MDSLSELRCRVLSRLSSLIPRISVLSQLSVYPVIRFAVAVVSSTMCERGTHLSVARESKGSKSGSTVGYSLNSQKIAARLIGCVRSAQAQRVCEACMIPNSQLLAEVVKAFGLVRPGEDRVDIVEQRITSDYKRVLALLRPGKKRDRPDPNTDKVLQAAREFLRAVFEGDIRQIYEKFLNLLDQIGISG